MAPEPPSFASVDYWDERFKNEPTTFEWLQDPRSLLDVLTQAIQESSTAQPQILHIGCGTSALPLLLRSLVSDPTTIHNTDFSSVALDLGRQREQEALANYADHFRDPVADHRVMRWVQLDLLSLVAISDRLAAEGMAQYDLILDKSTCDAVACGDDFRASLPYPLQTQGGGFTTALPDGSVEPSSRDQSSNAHIHPLHVLALHLAYVTAPGARWIAVTYASHRFPFLQPYPAKASDGRLSRWVVDAGFVHPNRLWELESKQEIATEAANPSANHEPRISHTLFILRRTSVKLELTTSFPSG